MQKEPLRYKPKKRIVEAEHLKKLHRRHFQGALVRSGASLFMWSFVLASYLFGALEVNHLAGVTVSVAFLILINPPTLWILNRITHRKRYKYFSLFINFLEIAGYTAIIHFLGGIEATFMIPVYAAVITYVGVVAPYSLPFIIAGFCAFAFSLLVTCEYFGFLPHRPLISYASLSAEKQLMILTIIVGLLFVVAFIASYTARLLKRNRDKLRNQNVELEKAVKKARESDRIKSEFLANMSHELRTPLNHIIGFTELILDRNTGPLSELQQEYLEDVHRSSRHLLSLVNDILDLSKVEAGKSELELSEMNIKAFLENSLIMVKDKAMKHGIKLSINTDSIPEMIKADERKLKQIIYNLLSNAVKFTPDGGSVHISANRLLGSGSERTKMGQNASEEWVQVSVSDTGIGIQYKDLKRIFEPFEQADSSTSKKFEGTGIGLSLAKSLVELHDGRIWAESEGAGKGSTFRFVIPV